MSGRIARTLLWAIAIPYCVVEAYLSWWMFTTYTFSEMGRVWVERSFSDSVLAVAFMDYVTLQLVVVPWMLAELPRERRWKPATCVWLVAFIVYPGLGAVLYFLWLHRDHRLLCTEEHPYAHDQL